MLNRINGRNEQGSVAVGAVLVLLGVFLVVGFIMLSMSLASTPADKVGVVWSGGPLDGKHYNKTLSAGQALTNIGILNTVYEYPITVRSYIISLNPTEGDRAGADSVHAVTKDNVQVEWQANTYFKLNTNKMKDFQQNIGFKYGADEQKGWDNMLSDYFRPQIENAMQTATRKYSVEDLYSSQEALLAIQSEVASDLKANINSALGDDYFCGPSFIQGKSGCPDFKFVIPKKPGVPDNIVAAFEENKSSAIAVKTAANGVLVKKQDAEGIAVLANATRAAGPAYLEMKRIEAQKIAAEHGSIFYIPYGSSVLLGK